MVNHAYRLPAEQLTRAQLEFFSRTRLLGLRVVFAKFGQQAEPLATFRAEVARIDEVFGDGAASATEDAPYEGYTLFPKLTRETLLSLRHLVEAAKAERFYDINEELTGFDNGADWRFEHYAAVGFDYEAEANIEAEIWALDRH